MIQSTKCDTNSYEPPERRARRQDVEPDLDREAVCWKAAPEHPSRRFVGDARLAAARLPRGRVDRNEGGKRFRDPSLFLLRAAPQCLSATNFHVAGRPLAPFLFDPCQPHPLARSEQCFDEAMRAVPDPMDLAVGPSLVVRRVVAAIGKEEKNGVPSAAYSGCRLPLGSAVAS